MHGSSLRSVATIDADLRALQAVQRDASARLAELRRRQSELADLEAELVVAIDLRSRRIDDVLDERLQATCGAAQRLQGRLATGAPPSSVSGDHVRMLSASPSAT